MGDRSSDPIYDGAANRALQQRATRGAALPSVPLGPKRMQPASRR
jgi:hypothetical protein